jgi:hypothetical protein
MDAPSCERRGVCLRHARIDCSTDGFNASVSSIGRHGRLTHESDQYHGGTVPVRGSLRGHRRAESTSARFRQLLPYRERIIHVRWSGEACWIPLGDLDLGLGFENHTSYPAPGQILLYPGGISETEILLAYGGVQFASKMGQLAGNHFLTVVEGNEHLASLGKLVLWSGAQDIVFSASA